MIEWVIEIEEAGHIRVHGEEAQVIQCMEQIPVWQRIEALSYTYVPVGQSATRLDITYTFCSREGVHTESLMVQQTLDS